MIMNQKIPVLTREFFSHIRHLNVFFFGNE